MLEQYQIEGTKNICEYDLNLSTYNNPNTWPTFQEDYKKFKNNIIDYAHRGESRLFLRIFDGEFLFLQGKAQGNVLRRHTHTHPSLMDLEPFHEGFLAADYVSTQLYPEQMRAYNLLFPDRKFDFPMEFLYAIVANKWIFKTFGNEIGIIGGEGKINLIKKLLEHQEYRDYLGIKSFKNYITVPEIYSCNNIELIEQNIARKLQEKYCKVYIFGIGISKLALAHRFKKYSNSVFLDVGCGVSALAGCTSLERPYYGAWTNFRIKNHDYRGIDPMDYRDTAGSNEVVLG